MVDALTDRDLDTIVTASVALPDALLCGSAGLAGALAARHARRHPWPPADQPPPPGLAGPGRVLLVVGSGCRRAHEQIAHLRGLGLCTHEVGSRAIPPATATARGALLLHLPEPGDVALEGPAARAAAAALARAALAALEQEPAAVLVLVGGDTAIAVLRRLGIAHLTVLREVLPGMPLTWGRTAGGVVQFVILKAGNHGDRAALAALMQAARAAR